MNFAMWWCIGLGTAFFTFAFACILLGYPPPFVQTPEQAFVGGFVIAAIVIGPVVVTNIWR